MRLGWEAELRAAYASYLLDGGEELKASILTLIAELGSTKDSQVRNAINKLLGTDFGEFEI